MADLIEAIVDQYDSGAEAATVALRALMGADRLCADQDNDNKARPYCVVKEAHWAREVEAINRTYRVENVVVEFNCYADTRSAIVALLDALEAAYETITLTTTGRVVLGTPTLEQRMIFNEADCYRGQLQLAYLTEKKSS